MRVIKKTTGVRGKITSLDFKKDILKVEDDDGKNYYYSSMEDFMNEWEGLGAEDDLHWFIDDYNVTPSCFYEHELPDRSKELKEIGNYFKTEEEVEKAVEKLKAWKRLKDKGFRFDDWDFYGNQDYRTFICFLSINKSLANPKDTDVIRKDLDLLFGGEE